MGYEQFITVSSDVRGGKPCIKGTRITVYDVLEYMAGGMSEADILRDFPSLSADHLRAVLAFAAARERRLAGSRGMKLLLDENLSPSLVRLVIDLFPDSTHIVDIAGTGATDTRVWELALQGCFAIVSKDNDFRQRSFVHGAPPKVVWLAVGNAGTATIAALLRRSADDMHRFDLDPDASLLVVNLSALP